MSSSEEDVFFGAVSSKERKRKLLFEQNSPVESSIVSALREKELCDVSVSLQFSSSNSGSEIEDSATIPPIKVRRKVGQYFAPIESESPVSDQVQKKCLISLRKQLMWKTDPKTKSLKSKSKNSKMSQVDISLARELLAKENKNSDTRVELLTCVHTVENARLIAQTPDKKSPKSSQIPHKVTFKIPKTLSSPGRNRDNGSDMKKSFLKSVLKKNHSDFIGKNFRVQIDPLPSSSSDSNNDFSPFTLK